jgi:CheY-like chemotaxis protein
MASISKNLQTVLVVEDEGLVRLDAAETLRDAGFAVVEAANAEQALAVVARDESVDLMFTDINMPGPMDGLELARRVSRLRPRIHLLLTSGKVRPTRAQIPDDGAFIPKPYSPEAVTRAVSAMLAT